MALIKISGDVFNIVDRVKEIDSGYFIVYNTKKHKYEVHNNNQDGSSFCITCDNGLNSTVISKLRKTRIENIDRILREIDENNAKIEQNAKKVMADETSFKLKEMFDYAKRKESDSDFVDSYKTAWA